MSLETNLFDNGAGIGCTVVARTLTYVDLVLLLRVSGKRPLSKVNAFDFIMTVALYSRVAVSSFGAVT